MVAEFVVLLTQASIFKSVMVRGPLGRGASARSGPLSGVAEDSSLLHCDVVLTGKYRHFWIGEVSQYSR
jgi:hypothetical protein